MISFNGWFWFLSENENLLDEEKCGKWMHFFQDQNFAKEICQKAINEGVCYECKCTDLDAQKTISGVICFYVNGDDMQNHKKVIQFMLDNELIPKTKTGRYYNNSFKFDHQTLAGEYGPDFNGKMKLDQFINLNTGEFLV